MPRETPESSAAKRQSRRSRAGGGFYCVCGGGRRKDGRDGVVHCLVAVSPAPTFSAWPDDACQNMERIVNAIRMRSSGGGAVMLQTALSHFYRRGKSNHEHQSHCHCIVRKRVIRTAVESPLGLKFRQGQRGFHQWLLKYQPWTRLASKGCNDLRKDKRGKIKEPSVRFNPAMKVFLPDGNSAALSRSRLPGWASC